MWMIPFWTHIEVPMKCPQQVYQLRQQVEEALSDLNRAIEVVQLNPYSALCNRMLTEPIGKLYTQWRDLK
jgi:hypothetical protein